MKSLKVIALDLDGTLLDSNHIKHNAFNEIFSEWPEHKDHIMSWHKTKNHMNRNEKFRYFVEEVLNEKNNNNKIENLSFRFSQLTLSMIVKCRWIKGANKFLKKFKNLIPLYIVSATPQLELEKIIKLRRMSDYFMNIYGSPSKKETILKKIINIEKIQNNEILYIGDSLEDEITAKKLSIDYINIDSDIGFFINDINENNKSLIDHIYETYKI